MKSDIWISMLVLIFPMMCHLSGKNKGKQQDFPFWIRTKKVVLHSKKKKTDTCTEILALRTLTETKAGNASTGNWKHYYKPSICVSLSHSAVVVQSAPVHDNLYWGTKLWTVNMQVWKGCPQASDWNSWASPQFQEVPSQPQRHGQSRRIPGGSVLKPAHGGQSVTVWEIVGDKPAGAAPHRASVTERNHAQWDIQTLRRHPKSRPPPPPWIPGVAGAKAAQNHGARGRDAVSGGQNWCPPFSGLSVPAGSVGCWGPDRGMRWTDS